jgi:hypothetical protein
MSNITDIFIYFHCCCLPINRSEKCKGKWNQAVGLGTTYNLKLKQGGGREKGSIKGKKGSGKEMGRGLRGEVGREVGGAVVEN